MTNTLRKQLYPSNWDYPYCQGKTLEGKQCKRYANERKVEDIGRIRLCKQHYKRLMGYE